MIGKLLGGLHRESVAKVIRTFLIAFLGIAVPGLFGWLNSVTDWATTEGQEPFPDAHSLGFLLVAGITAGSVALLNLIWLYVEDTTGKGFLRDPSTDKQIPPQPIAEGGRISVPVSVPLMIILAWSAALSLVLSALLF